MTTAQDPTTPTDAPRPPLPLRESRADDGRLTLFRGPTLVGWTQRGYSGRGWEAHWRDDADNHRMTEAANADAAAVALRKNLGA